MSLKELIVKANKLIMFMISLGLACGLMTGCGGGHGGGDDHADAGGGGVNTNYEWKPVVFYTYTHNEDLYAFVRPYEYELAYPEQTGDFENELPKLAVAPLENYPETNTLYYMYLPQGDYSVCYEIFHPDTREWTHRIVGSLPNEPVVSLNESTSEDMPPAVYVGDDWSQFDKPGACDAEDPQIPPTSAATLVIENQPGSGADIVDVYISPSSNDYWGPDLLTGEIAPGAEQDFTIADCDKETDFKLVFSTASGGEVREMMNNYIECGSPYKWSVSF